MRTLLLAASLLASAAPLPALAHAILLDSKPAPGSTVAPGDTPLVLRFNSRIDAGRSRLVLRGAGAEATLPLQPGSPADTLAARTALRPGAYTIHWQVLAVDGHITRGDVAFTVRTP